MVSLLIFMFLGMFIPGKFGDILQIINAIALLIFILFSLLSLQNTSLNLQKWIVKLYKIIR